MTAPIVSLVLLYCAWFAYLVFSANGLPDRPATHFRLNGQPNGWMSRSAYLVTIALTALAAPLSLPGFALLLVGANADFMRFALWFACLTLGFVFGIHALVMHANRQAPAKLSNMFWALVALFATGIILWVIQLERG